MCQKEVYVLRAFIACSLGVFFFFSNHKVHHQTTKVYQISDKRDQVEELSKISGRTTAVMVKQVTYSVQESVNSKVL
jgi:hypothetical protein